MKMRPKLYDLKSSPISRRDELFRSVQFFYVILSVIEHRTSAKKATAIHKWHKLFIANLKDNSHFD